MTQMMCGAVRACEPVGPIYAMPDEESASHFDALQPGQQMQDADPIVGRDVLAPPPPPPPGAPRPLKSPKPPTALERERHNITSAVSELVSLLCRW